MAFFNLKFILAFGYCSISFVIYTLLIIMLLKNWKDFKSAFFHIVIADYFFNLLTWLNSMITLRLPNGTCKDCVLSNLFASLGKDNQYTSSFLFFCYFLHFGNAYFQYFMVTLMAVNRTTSIFFYFVNEKIWSILFPLSLGAVILVEVFFTRTILSTKPYFVFNEALDMYSIKSDSDILSAYSNVIIFMGFCVICSIVCNFLSIMQLKLMKKNLSTIERNLLFSTLASSVIQCAAAGNTFLLQFDRNAIYGQIGQLLLPFFSDFLTISQPYILILMSSKVRNGMLKNFFGKESKASSLFVKTQGNFR
ncbi:Serpentine receptor class gamma [Caenorhabditis elegans]|uniref:Serpentine receptor class gamma n=1 Tax=Caenorhabditis elegans TaxID=6239 RepID=Q60F72_CAEEL|nr:Serpentine receptor class gamma [Caenorhabditis elegans]CCD83526.2 Serpentine receptor class gamma [Caenorhabditis elegans]|eukprot:NP_001023503.2 Serpentine receptor class gamma [Caenorhabditis elegans]